MLGSILNQRGGLTMEICVNDRNYLTDKRIEWHKNKISGGIAEATCRAHFEALGYSVESFGIENIAPQYCSIKDGVITRGEYGAQFKDTLQNMPDFLVSRCHPNTPSIAKSSAVGHLDAFLVDAKFRTTVSLNEFKQEIFEVYEKILDRDIHFFIYLVAKNSRTFFKGNQNILKVGDKELKAYIHLGYFPGKEAKLGKALWWTVGETKLLDMPICHGMDEGDNFTSVYAEIIYPALNEFLG